MVSLFFEQLGSKFRKENDLSDITWALCNSSSTFKEYFLDFFFKGEIDYSKEITLYREYSGVEGARPDFWFMNGEKEFLIECKIYDQNHHFTQYNSCFPNAQKGYICNYHIGENVAGYEIRTWKYLSKFLLEKISTLPDSFEKEMIKGYIDFLKIVCNIFEIQKMNLTNLDSLISFHELLKEIINTPIKIGEDLFSFSVNNQTKNFTHISYGLFFGVFKNGERYVVGDPWIGLYFNHGLIFIGFPYLAHEDSGYHFLAKASNDQVELHYSKIPYEDSSSYWFELKKDFMDTFNNPQTTLERQKEIVHAYFKEAIETLVKFKK